MRLVLALFVIPLAAQTPEPRATLTRYCLGCHHEKVKTGGFALDPAAPPEANPEAWEKVVRRLRARQMPPAGLPRPDEATYSNLVASLETKLDRLPKNPGRTDTFRRLTRTEYQNAIRDLLALDVDVSSLLPADETGHGFDNVTVGELSPTLLERYVSAARTVSRLAIGIAAKSPGGDTFRLPPDLTQEDRFDELPPGTRGGTVVGYTFPVDAEYEIQVRLARDRNEHVEGLHAAHDVEVTLDGERVGLFTVVPPKGSQDHSKADQHLNVRMRIAAGPHRVAALFPKRPSLLIETERQPYNAHFNMDRHPRIQPAVFSVTINGPYDAQGPGDTPSRRRVMVCKPASAATELGCAERILSTLMRRAYRRPVTREDIAAPLKFFREARAAESFDAAIEMAVRSILVSPEFLFRVERDPVPAAAGAYRVSDLELASRLSFFLWSSVPDDELLGLAESRKLSDPATLEKQVRRMLADPKAGTLSTNFAAQWLGLRRLAAATPDMRLYPDFDDNLRRSFRRETEMFFESVHREDRNILDLIRARYTFLNERLAKHYGVPHVYGGHFRRVEMDPTIPRGGLLRHGSILTVTSYATRTSPVIRGKWVLENLLGTAPPPAPPAVPSLKENVSTGTFRTMRERLAEHRDNPACSGCHQLMDPAGFSLENYDAIGRWREFENSAPIDVAGGLPDGSRFSGVAGLEQAVLARPELFAGALTERLLVYALGRGIEASDAPAVRSVVREAKDAGYRFSSIILGIVRSTPFQMRRPS
ncbi:MAG: DUF1592 domain-containing protein [Bryobacteraceae bacterium]|nr:DUF1592 domain-containing protein [Bryobacteraceae bacterium]